MAKIDKLMDQHAGRGISKESGAATMREILEEVADDLAALQPAVLASAAAVDLATAITLVNEIKGALNATAGATIKTVRE